MIISSGSSSLIASGGPCSDLQKAGGNQVGDGGELAAARNQDDCANKISQTVITSNVPNFSFPE